MESQPKKQISKLRRPFVAAGAVAGAGISVWYLVANFGISTIVPDPIWLKFVKVALIMFCSIYLANLLRNVVEKVIGKK
ncbi:hypothetical protein L4X63_10005 [Geomonas sp. Red32]|uniref:hypothetical protein n=1 Tax=Geomonas sp. Red32 TaxID=2912856 RepID=UPI00202CEB03|nr:hypothetical protein [Geomonas sp. Red32]MCM0081923.1 hypothetical protein [Geomonas sp. Red32]